jgi:hypothetical protein
VDVAEAEISTSIRELKRVPLEWGEEVRFTSYQGKEPVGSFSVELLSVVGTLESSHWDRLLVRYAWENESFGQAIDIEQTEANFGGFRDWFVCPGCRRRCGTLYIRRRVRCRICHGLAYLTQTEHDVERRLRRIGKRRERLGGSRWILADFPPKPKRMHWRTYNRLLSQDTAEVDQHFREGIADLDAAMGARFLAHPAKEGQQSDDLANSKGPDFTELVRSEREAMESLLANAERNDAILRELAETAKTPPFSSLKKRRKSK